MRTGYYQWGYDATSDHVYRYDTVLGHFVKMFLATNIPSMVLTISDNCVIFQGNNSVSPPVDVYAPALTSVVDIGIIDANAALQIVTGADRSNRVSFKTTSANSSLYAKGDSIEFYDCWDSLWFRGIITDKVVGRGTCSFLAEDSTMELARPYNADFDAKPATILTTITGSLTHGYAGTIQDVNYEARTPDYHLSVHDVMQPYVRFHRGLERGVIWVTPAGEWNFDHYDDCDATGYRVKHKTGLGWKLKSNESNTIDKRVTQASVRAASNTRSSYIGNAARAAVEGVVAAREHADDALQAADTDSATSLAEQLYAIFSTETTFLHFMVVNHGFLQPGKTIDVSWSLGDTTVARTTMIIIAVKAYILADVQEVIVSNNIVTEDEMRALKLVDESK